MIDIPIMVALFDDNRVAVAAITTLAHDVPVAIAVAMSFADGYAARTHTDANFFRDCRKGGSNKGCSRDNGGK